MRAMQWTVVALVVVTLAVGTVAESALLEVQHRLASALDRASYDPVKENCPVDWHEVAEERCCPNEQPKLIAGQCYPLCEQGEDDLVLGSFIGCRDQCPGGYSSEINTCTRDALQHTRIDNARDGVATQMQSYPDRDTDTTCPDGYVKVSRLPRGRGKKRFRTHRGGGCCPKAAPLLIGSECYADCPSDQDPIIVGDYIGCRAHCPDGWTEDHNDCTKTNEDTVERSDYPRTAYPAAPRVKAKTSRSAIDRCDEGYVAASNNYCCPFSKPQLKGLLCYERCPRGWEEEGYGCRRKCKKGWSSTHMTCNRKGRVTWRKGYERHPVPSRTRGKDNTPVSTSTGGSGPTPIAS